SNKIIITMTALDPNKFLERLSPRLARLLQGNARHSLLGQVNTVLMVYDARLYDLSNGSWRPLSEEALHGDAATLADSALALLNEVSERAVMLLLPSNHFFATSVQMPGVARENLRAALLLQAGILLPTYESVLTFAVKPRHSGSDESDVVLWTDGERLDALFEAFAEKGLFLTAVMPRPLVTLGMMGRSGQMNNAETWQLEDQDDRTLTWL